MKPTGITYDQSTAKIMGYGDWIIAHYEIVKNLLPSPKKIKSAQIILDGKQIKKMDTTLGYLVIEYQKKLKKAGINLIFENFSPEIQELFAIITKDVPVNRIKKIKSPNVLAKLGMLTTECVYGFLDYLSFVGQLTTEAGRLLSIRKFLRFSALSSIIYRNGYSALPIIALLSFMIGVVITYQMGLQLKNYGANIYIVDLLGLSILREFAPLLTAIMVAGRTGSSFTAELGMMKINQEIDAINTLGITPAELLLIPRVLGLLIALPLLTMWSDIFGVFGGMIMANNMLSISWYDFLHRFPSVIPLKALLIGLGKTPVFAAIIATIGCFQGMTVKNSSDSVGQNTTRSVVLAIFFIILADAIFSVIFSKLKL